MGCEECLQEAAVEDSAVAMQKYLENDQKVVAEYEEQKFLRRLFFQHIGGNKL